MIYRIHPYYFADKYNLREEDEFYKTLKELGIKSEEIREIIMSARASAGNKETCSPGGC